MKIYLILLSLLFSTAAKAGFWLQPSIHYATDADDNTNFEYASSHYSFLLGATFGKKGNWVVGQSVVSWARSEGSDTTDPANEISMLELGPRIMYLFGQGRNFYIAGTYNFYAKGTRNVDGDEFDIDGSSYIVSFGVQMKGTKKFYLGFSINYHTTAIAEESQDDTKADVTNGYSKLYPAIDISLRFK